jgi:hypothetical protein
LATYRWPESPQLKICPDRTIINIYDMDVEGGSMSLLPLVGPRPLRRSAAVALDRAF